jgi:MFS family permease
VKDAALDKGRWLVLLASCLVNLCIGSLYAWSVFSTPMHEHLSAIAGTDVGSLAIVFTGANAVGPITMISGGMVNDRIGPRWVVLVGGTLFGLGMIASGFVISLPMLVVTYGLGCGLGMGMVYGAVVSNAVKFFPDKRGLVGGIATASYGASSVIVPIVANALISALDVMAAFRILGIAMLVVICVASLFIKSCPEGYVPAGWEPPMSRGRGATIEKDWRGMLGDPAFYLMISMLLCGAFSGLMITSQASPIAQEMVGMNAVTAALVVSVLALANTAGRIVSGQLSDKLGVVSTLRLVFSLLVVGMAILYASAGAPAAVFCVGVCVVGFCFGSVMGIYPGFTAAQFGGANNSVNYGIMFVGFALAGFLAPTIMNALVTATGSYRPAFAVAAVLGILGIVLTAVFARQQRRMQE